MAETRVVSDVTPRIVMSAHDGYVTYPADMTMRILDPDQRRAPTSLTVSVSGAIPEALVAFSIDGGDPVYVLTDASGSINAVNIAVDGTLLAGTHTLDATVGSGSNVRSASGTFTLAKDPPVRHVIGPDADPVEVPGALNPDGSRSWVFQDLMPGGLGSWVLPRNPRASNLPEVRRTLSPHQTTARAGQHHIFESVDDTQDWTFEGVVFTQAEHQKFEAYGNLNRRFYLLDDDNRAWVVAFTKVDLTPRQRTRFAFPGQPDQYSDWVADYTVTATVYGVWHNPV
jgi:hypothetical protein